MIASTKDRWIERGFFEDLRVLYSQKRLAWQLYIADIAENKRNSGLGLVAPFASVLIHVLLLGSVMGLVFQEELIKFIPFFAVSFSLWQGISIFVSDISFSNEKATRFLSFPNISGYISSVIALYDFLVAVLLKMVASVLIILFVNPSIVININLFGFLGGILMMAIALFCWSVPFAYLFDRLRILRGFLPQMLFAVYLITPILWSPERLSSHKWLIYFNPVYHLVEIARSPLLEGEFPEISFLIVVVISAIGFVASYKMFSLNRELIVFRWIA